MQNGIALPNGSYLEEYLIEKELGTGTLGVTYLATDTNLDKQVVIKEYFPNDIATRENSEKIVPKSKGEQESFEYGLDRFIHEATIVSNIKHSNIIEIKHIFQTNNSAYFVADYYEGEDLEEYMRRKNSFSEEEILSIIMPILDGLRAVHNADSLHRDIKPGNIYIRDNFSPMLIDFGASRMAMGRNYLSNSLALGYAPKEEYGSFSKKGSYTDLYAIGAVMYKMATGITPPDARDRADAITDDEPDPFELLQYQNDLNYSDNFKKAVDWALEYNPKDRPQSVNEFLDGLNGKIEIKAKVKIESEIKKSSNSLKDKIISFFKREKNK